jgi:hypothetical protein
MFTTINEDMKLGTSQFENMFLQFESLLRPKEQIEETPTSS